MHDTLQTQSPYILFIEANPSIVDYLFNDIQRIGFKVVQAESIEKAQKKLKEHDIEVVFFNLSYSDSHELGMELYDELLKSDIKVIAYTPKSISQAWNDTKLIQMLKEIKMEFIKKNS